MKLFPLLLFFFLVGVGIAIIRSKKFPYWWRGLNKPFFVEGNVAVVFGLILVIVGILVYFYSIEDLL